jgi:hypothetical protein
MNEGGGKDHVFCDSCCRIRDQMLSQFLNKVQSVRLFLLIHVTILGDETRLTTANRNGLTTPNTIINTAARLVPPVQQRL